MAMASGLSASSRSIAIPATVLALSAREVSDAPGRLAARHPTTTPTADTPPSNTKPRMNSKLKSTLVTKKDYSGNQCHLRSRALMAFKLSPCIMRFPVPASLPQESDGSSFNRWKGTCARCRTTAFFPIHSSVGIVETVEGRNWQVRPNGAPPIAAKGGSRTSPLPDFFIGAHAQAAGHALLTRDPAHARQGAVTRRVSQRSRSFAHEASDDGRKMTVG